MINMFSTRTMLAMLEQMYKPFTFLRDTFFSKVERSTTEYVDIDIIKGKRRLAPFVRAENQAKLIERLDRKTNSFKPPYIKMKMLTSAADILNRMNGNTIYQGNSSPAQQASAQLGEDIDELRMMIVRREEWMSAQALDTGIIEVVGEGFTAEIDFQMLATHKPAALAGGARWTEGTSDPLNDIDEWCGLVAKDSGIVPDRCIMGISALKAFKDNDNVQNMLDNRRIVLGQIDPHLTPSGAVYVGTLKGLYQVDVYAYNDWYLDDNGVLQPMVPIKKVWIGSTQARTARHYGAIKDLKAGGNFAVEYFPKSWEQEDPSGQIVMLQSAPVMAMHQPDAFYSRQVVDV